MHYRVMIHFVWTTRNRDRVLDYPRAQFLWANLPVIARQEHARVIALGIVATHVHAVVAVDTSTDVARMLQRMKGGSSHAINRQQIGDGTLRWAKGYSATSVSPWDVDRVAAYAQRQHVHHPREAIPDWCNPAIPPDEAESRPCPH